MSAGVTVSDAELDEVERREGFRAILGAPRFLFREGGAGCSKRLFSVVNRKDMVYEAGRRVPCKRKRIFR